MLAVGLGSCWAALAVLVLGVLVPRRRSLPIERRRPDLAARTTALGKLTGAASARLADFLERRGLDHRLAAALEQAGLALAPADYLILAGAGSAVAAMAGWMLGGPLLGLLGIGAGALGARVHLSMRTGKRRKKFADQLDDTLQLLSGGLRAGHSLLRAIDAVSHQAASPTAEEFSRIINETRLGRDLGEALDQTAQRTRSEDFSWIAQAIAIHREVGGDLAQVLDQVGATIRERGQLKRQIKALAAEGKMSAYVLMALPVLVIGVLALISPSYIRGFTSSPIGWGMVVAGLVMMTVGGLWMKKIVSFKF